MNKITINLVTWNAEKYIEACLSSVLNQNFKDYSLIIIDNGSTDRTLELINERYPHLRIIKQKTNIGFDKAHNQAIHWSKSEYVLCLNQDVVLEPDYLEKAVSFMDGHPLVGSLTGKILRSQDSEKTKYIDSLGLKLNKNYSVVDIAAGEQDDGQFDINEEVFGVSGACPVYRRKALDEVMYKQEFFDEDFFIYKEDIDLAHRLRLAGWQAWYLPSITAYHDRTAASEKEKSTKREVLANRKRKAKYVNFYSYRNHLYFLIKNLPKLTWSVFWYEFLKFVYVLFAETRNLKGFFQMLKNYKKMKAKREVIYRNSKVKPEEMGKWQNAD